LDGFGLNQAWSVAWGAVAHVKGIAVCEVRREIAVIGDGNIGAFFSELDVVSVVVESMREETGS